MARLLMRSGKDPFTAVGAETTLEQGLLRTNIGNQLFQLSVQRALTTAGTEIVSNGALSEMRPPAPSDIERTNAEFDAFVVPLANAFRPQFATRSLVHLTSFIQGLTIPVVVVGVGVQADVNGSFDDLRGIADPVRAFVSAVLERSSSIGVRGEETAKFLHGLGFPHGAVDVIGCPSLYLNGPDFRLSPAPPWPGREARIALNVTPEVPGLGSLCRDWVEQHPQLELVGQDVLDLALVLWGEERRDRLDPGVPTYLDHPLYRQGRVVFPLDGRTWIEHLRGFDMAVGTRFHGNVAALLADTPAMALVHDARMRELVNVHRIPHRPARDPRQPTLEELYAEYDPTEFNDAYPQSFATFTTFLERNRLCHVYRPGDSPTAFDEQLAAATLPPLARPLPADLPAPVRERLSWLRHAATFDPQRHPDSYRYPYPHPAPRGANAAGGRRHRRAAEQLEAHADALENHAKRIAKLESAAPGLRRRFTWRGALRRLRDRRSSG